MRADKPPVWRGKTVRVPVPKTRDPFVNTPLLPVGRDARGEERFWISTWNNNVGCLAALVTESGDYRVYRFRSPRHGGFYSAAAEDENTLWLCGDLSRVVRLKLDTGKFEEFPTGAPSALVFSGMALDQRTGKLFAAAYPYPKCPQTTAFSFDFRAGKPVKIHDDIAAAHCMQLSFPNGDGTWSIVLQVPGQSLVRWDPVTETVTARNLEAHVDAERLAGGTAYRLIGDERGRWYFPARGWFEPKTAQFDPGGPRPQREMTWFAWRGARAWGADYVNGNIEIGVWDMATGQVRPISTIPDSQLHNVNLTASGKIVAVNMYGEFFRFDGDTGALELSKRLPTDSIGHTDRLRRIDAERLLGTPFITQRFWEVNLRTGRGADCGRAAPGAGEILLTWTMGRRIYLAAYGGGELMEYNPAQPARFPENPRVVADPPHGMRPVAGADAGRHLYYSCSSEYGTLGSVLTRYDTRTGATRYRHSPLPDQQIISLQYDKPAGCLVAGTTMHANCQSCPPTSDQSYFALIGADDLAVRRQAAAPKGTLYATVRGPMGRGRYLCLCHGEFEHGPRWFVLNVASFAVPALEATARMPGDTEVIGYAGRPGYFVLPVDGRIELWDMRVPRCVRILRQPFPGVLFHVQDDSVYLIEPKTITVLEHCLRGMR